MENADAVVAVFSRHNTAEFAVKRLAAAGFGMMTLGVVGEGFHIEEEIVGFHHEGDAGGDVNP